MGKEVLQKKMKDLLLVKLLTFYLGLSAGDLHRNIGLRRKHIFHCHYDLTLTNEKQKTLGLLSLFWGDVGSNNLYLLLFLLVHRRCR